MAQPTPTEPPTKKRRSFFSSTLNIKPRLPVQSTTRPTTIASSEVLAALSAPEEVPVPKKARGFPAREGAGDGEVGGGGAGGVAGQKRARTKKEESGVPPTPIVTGVEIGGRSLRVRQSVRYSDLGVENLGTGMLEGRSQAPLSPPGSAKVKAVGGMDKVKTGKRHSMPASMGATTMAMGTVNGEGSGRAGDGGVPGPSGPPLLRTPTSASRRGYKAPVDVPAAANTSKRGGKAANGSAGDGGGKNAQHAQSVNERLSQMMLAGMRATIGGRDEPYKAGTRVGWGKSEVGSTTAKRKRSHSTSAVGVVKPLKVVATTARQKAKLQAEQEKEREERKAKGLGEKEEDEEEEEGEEMMDERVEDGFEDLSSSDEEGPVGGRGKGARSRKTNGRNASSTSSDGKARGDADTTKSNGQGETNGTQNGHKAAASSAASAKGSSKEYMTSGFYCQDANAKSPYKLINKILGAKKGGRKSRAAAQAGALSFPPLPYDHGYNHFFGQEHEFVLPYNIYSAASNGALNDKKKPAPYQKVRGNVFPDRQRITCPRVICECAEDSGCGDSCINRIMSYLCGRDCPSGEGCTNRSLVKRAVPETKVKYTGSRGFGLFAMQDISEGDFVIDYRGEVIGLGTFHERLVEEYAGQRNFYALAYDQDEVIDAGMRGNDARFINHGCDPNLEVRKYQQLGDGLQEYEVGMWALRDIKKGDELFYNYNFDWFGEAKDSLRAQCKCGAENCIGILGRRNGDPTAREMAIEVEAQKIAEAAKKIVKGRKGVKKFGRKMKGPAGRRMAEKGVTAAGKRARVALATRKRGVAKGEGDKDGVEETGGQDDDADEVEDKVDEVDEGGGVGEGNSGGDQWENIPMAGSDQAHSADQDSSNRTEAVSRLQTEPASDPSEGTTAVSPRASTPGMATPSKVPGLSRSSTLAPVSVSNDFSKSTADDAPQSHHTLNESITAQATPESAVEEKASSTTLTPRSRAANKRAEKKLAIAKRNGAPMGWAYEVVVPVLASAVALEENLGRGARRARQSLPLRA